LSNEGAELEINQDLLQDAEIENPSIDDMFILPDLNQETGLGNLSVFIMKSHLNVFQIS